LQQIGLQTPGLRSAPAPVAAAVGMVVATLFGASTAAAEDSWVSTLGLGLDEIHIAGHRQTEPDDIFACLGKPAPTTLIALDSRHAKACIEALPWIQAATLTRIYPGRLEVRLSERRPQAVWHLGKRAVLIDDTTRVLSKIAPASRPDLFQIAGEGAPEALASLLEALRSAPEIAGRVTLATRVEGRRWSLALDGGSRIELPAEGEAAALAEIERHRSRARLLAPSTVIDLRSRFEIAVRATVPTGADRTGLTLPSGATAVALPADFGRGR